MSGPSRSQPHRSLDEILRSSPSGNQVGDDPTILPKPGWTRVVYQNIQTLPESPVDPEQEAMSRWLKDHQVGVALLGETNRRWSAMPEGTSWSERVRKVHSTGYYAITANNSHEKEESSFQWGGVAAALLNNVSHAAGEKGRDPTGLGRWSYLRIRGKTDKNGTSKDLVCISAYQCQPDGGPLSVYAQQRRHFLLQDRPRLEHPRAAFTSDLQQEIRRWQDQGCEIILGVDANEDVSAFSPTSFWYHMKEEVGLDEAIIARTGKTNATSQLNSKGVPIDGIFVSQGVNVKAGGYYAFDEFFPSDHRALWIDIDLHRTLGGFSPQPRRNQVRKLSTLDTRSTRRYLKLAEQGYLKYNIPVRLQKLEDVIAANNGIVTSDQFKIYSRLHEDAYMIRRLAEKQCRKCAMGDVPWSPQMQRLWDRLTTIRLLKKARSGIRVSSHKLRRLVKKTKMQDLWDAALPELEIVLRDERKKYKVAKKDHAAEWRRQHVRVQLREAKRRMKRSTKAKERYHRLRRMLQREEVRRRRRARGKGSRGGLCAIQVASQDDPDRLEMVTDQYSVEQACMEENSRRYDQTRFPYTTPPMKEPLYSMFNGGCAEENSEDLLRGALPLPKTDAPSHSFLTQCRYHRGFQPDEYNLTTTNHIEFWSRADETKGSEPHGLHNGHFKAGTQSPPWHTVILCFGEFLLILEWSQLNGDI